MRVNVYVYIYNAPNVLNLQDFVAGMLKYQKGRCYILNATLPVVSITYIYVRVDEIMKSKSGKGAGPNMVCITPTQ